MKVDAWESRSFKSMLQDIFPFAVVLMARTLPLAQTPLSLKAKAAIFPCEHHLPPTYLWHCSQDPQQSLMPDLLLPLLIWHTPQSHCVTQWHKIFSDLLSLKPCDQATVLLVFTEERSNLSILLFSSSPSTRQIFWKGETYFGRGRLISHQFSTCNLRLSTLFSFPFCHGSHPSSLVTTGNSQSTPF